jgi:hypothetical protein
MAREQSLGQMSFSELTEPKHPLTNYNKHPHPTIRNQNLRFDRERESHVVFRVFVSRARTEYCDRKQLSGTNNHSIIYNTYANSVLQELKIVGKELEIIGDV